MEAANDPKKIGDMNVIPSWSTFAATVAQAAINSEPVVTGEAAVLYVLAHEAEGLVGRVRPIPAEDLTVAAAQGRMAVVVSEAPRAACAYLAVIRQGSEEVVGIQIDISGQGQDQMISFGAPLMAKDGIPHLGGQLWALNHPAALALEPQS